MVTVRVSDETDLQIPRRLSDELSLCDGDQVELVRPGDVVFAQVTVKDIEHAKRRVALDCRCMVGDTTVLKGEALVLAPSRKFD